MKQFILKALILFYIFSSFALATHVHLDADGHGDDCQICVVVKTFSDVDVPNFDILLSCNLCNYVLERYSFFSIHYFNLKGFFSHAPPFLSF